MFIPDGRGQMSLIDVVLVGGGTLHREGLRQSLDQSQFAVVAGVSDFSSVPSLVSKGTSPRLVVADFSRESGRDFEGLRRLRDAAPDCRIVVLSNELNFTDLARALRAGADGYLVSNLSREAFALSLLVVMSGEKVLPGSLADVLASNDRDLCACRLSNGHSNLTDRERQILQCLVEGYSNKLISRELNITEGTVKVHLKVVMRKISAVNRTQAALWARSHGIGDAPAAQETPVASADLEADLQRTHAAPTARETTIASADLEAEAAKIARLRQPRTRRVPTPPDLQRTHAAPAARETTIASVDLEAETAKIARLRQLRRAKEAMEGAAKPKSRRVLISTR
jgi:two-component system, NarL family, nitrate/nitrite response regulator NarL